VVSVEQSRRFVITGHDPGGRNRTIILWREAEYVGGPVVRRVVLTLDATMNTATVFSLAEAREVKTILDNPPKVWAWGCGACGTDWAVTAVNLQVRPWLVQLAEDSAALAVLQEITTLAEQVDTLTDDQLRVRLINCWVRLDQICRHGADPHAPAGHRLNDAVPGAPPVPDPAITAPESTGTIR
jgi:hypothetical protein